MKIVIIVMLCSIVGQTAFAAIGSSSNYTLDIADITNSGSDSSSSSYDMTGIVGDNFDGTSSSTSYSLCSGFAEEAFSDCIAASPPVPPPDPGGTPGGAGGRPPGYKAEIPDPEEVPPELPPEPEEPGHNIIIIKPLEPALPIIEEPPIIEPVQPRIWRPAAPATTPADIRCTENACYGHASFMLRGAAPETQTVLIYAPLWPLILVLALAFLLYLYLKRKEQQAK